jgi:hypothetical protein
MLLAALVRVGAQEPLPRVALIGSGVQIIRGVPAEPVAGVYANSVKADLVIGVDGRVESVRVLSGHKAHHASAVAALKQYRFAPVMIGGKATRVVLNMGIHVPDTFAGNAVAGDRGSPNAVSVGPRRDVTLRAECSGALAPMTPGPGAIEVCRSAAEATDNSSAATAFDRRGARSWLADAYLLAEQWAEAVTHYQAALAIDVPAGIDDVKTGEMLTKTAIANMRLGHVEAADRHAAAAVATVERSMAAHPDQRSAHVDALRTIYQFYAQLKRLRGDAEAAAALERKAADLAVSR